MILGSVFGYGQLKSPDDFLPHKLGEHFTPHHMLVDYVRHVAAESPLVTLVEYGKTNQGRPLIVAVVTSEANHANLEEIRKTNLRMAGLEVGEINTDLSKAIVWLSFSVHGNEAAGSESSRKVLYDLVDPSNSKTKKWLENTIVIIDPAVNPDGFSRYTHWVRDVGMDVANTDIQDIEHHEPWPGGRVNHFLFDLNRDWAWQTQVESQQRMKLYNTWLPHVHADLHEMGHESPYYFAPAAKPYHKYITKWQRDFQVKIGKNHAKYFDAKGWLYFTKEVFDLFYPSYGDTYPIYSGAIGMTYEQGGSSVGGRGIKLKNGQVLTLKDRIDHHATTALSTIEITSLNAEEVKAQFTDFYKKAASNPPGPYRTYVIKKDPSGQRVDALADLLKKQGIQYGTVASKKRLSGFEYQKHTEGGLDVMPGDLVVSALQPKAIMTQILLDPSSELEDSLTYDITAWSLPYAYGLNAIASKQTLKADADYKLQAVKTEKVAASYGYLIPWQDLSSSRLVAGLLQEGLMLRTIPTEIKYEGVTYGRGAVVITRADNMAMGDRLYKTINKVLSKRGGVIHSLETGFAEMGPDLGSGKIKLIKQPKVLALSGDRISNTDFGQIKWFFDRVIKYPLTIADKNRLGRIDLNKYTTLILPHGWYQLDKSSLTKISKWVAEGGKVIAISGATKSLVDKEGFGLKKFASEEDKKANKKSNQKADLIARYNHYSNRQREAITDYVPGAIFKLKVDDTHPLSFGLGSNYYSLKTNSLFYPLVVDESNVIYHYKTGGNIIGFAGAKVKEKLKDSVVFAVENKGRGQIVYMIDNPLFRGFWYNGLFLFSNALFQVN